MCTLNAFRTLSRRVQNFTKPRSSLTRSFSQHHRSSSASSSSQTSAAHNTVDESELSKFSAQAADWWHPNGSAAALHRLNPLRIAYIRSAIEKHCASINDRIGHQSMRNASLWPSVCRQCGHCLHCASIDDRSGRQSTHNASIRPVGPRKPLAAFDVLDVGCGGKPSITLSNTPAIPSCMCALSIALD